MQELRINDVVRFRLIFGIISWINGDNVGLISLEEQDGGVVAKLDQLEFIRRPKEDENEDEIKESIEEVVRKQRVARKEAIEKLRTKDVAMKEVMQKMRDGGAEVEEIVDKVRVGKYKDEL